MIARPGTRLEVSKILEPCVIPVSHWPGQRIAGISEFHSSLHMDERRHWRSCPTLLPSGSIRGSRRAVEAGLSLSYQLSYQIKMAV